MFRNCLAAALCVLFAVNAWADVPADRTRIAELALKINAAAARQVDPSALAEARQLMRRALKRLRDDSGGEHRKDKCVEFATSVYARNLQERVALERAMKRCKTPVDHKILRFAYEVYARNLQPRAALDRAFRLGQDTSLRRRLPILKFATEIYAHNLQARSALDRAVRFVKALPPRFERCVRSAYPTYRKSLQARSAIERAARTCQQ